MVVVRVVLRGAVAFALCGITAHAQPRSPDHTEELGVIESTERNEDPLGIDPSTGSGLDQAAAALPRAPTPPPPTPVRGAAFSALSQVREETHAVEVTLEQGLAFVRLRMRLTSRAKHASELSYRLALPAGAVPVKVALCSAWTGCLAGTPSETAQTERYTSWLTQLAGGESSGEDGTNERLGAGLSAMPIEDAGGPALALRAAPLPPDRALDLEVEYVAEAPVRGGRVHFTLPARGYDPNLASSRVEIRAPGFTLLGPENLEWPPELPLTVRAELPHGAHLRPRATRAPCGTGSRCTRSFEAIAAELAEARPTWLWIDASPSMAGPARGRVDAVLAALLSRLPPHTPMRAFAFAARAEPLGSFTAEQASLSSLSQATLRELGAATRLSHVLDQSARELVSERPRVFILSDGLFDADPREVRALETARRKGAELWLIDVGDGAPQQPFAGVRRLEVAQAADLFLRGVAPEPLSDALCVALSREPIPGLYAGEQRVREHSPKKLGVPSADAHWLWFWLARGRGPHSFVAFSRQAGLTAGPIAALPFESSPPRPAPAHTAMPQESVLDMLRTQLVPRARACLRSDRRGRGDYAVALTFRAVFAHREVSNARVEGDIREPLRACLEALLPNLRVPDFSGSVRVRYPIYTQREAPPPVIELTRDAAEQVRRAMQAPEPRR